MRFSHLISVIGLAVVLAACNQSDSGGTTGGQSAAMGSAFPADLVVDSVDGETLAITAAKQTATAGEPITVHGYIGGRAQPFADSLAVFTIVDTDQVAPCDAKPGDTCPQPWDFCCEAPDKVAAASATVQVADESGTVVRAGLAGHRGLCPGARVVVDGLVSGAGDEGLVIDATAIEVISGQSPAGAGKKRKAGGCGGCASGGCGAER